MTVHRAPLPAFAPGSPAAQGYEQLCRFRGTVRGTRVDCLGQRGHSWGAPDWSKIALTRTLTAWMDTETAVSVSAVRSSSLPGMPFPAPDGGYHPTKDEVAVISFTGESTLEQGMTNNLQRLRRAIDRVQFVPPAGYIGGGVMAPGTPRHTTAFRSRDMLLRASFARLCERRIAKGVQSRFQLQHELH